MHISLQKERHKFLRYLKEHEREREGRREGGERKRGRGGEERQSSQLEILRRFISM